MRPEQTKKLVEFIGTQVGEVGSIKLDFLELEVSFNYWINDIEEETLAVKIFVKKDLRVSYDMERHRCLLMTERALNMINDL